MTFSPSASHHSRNGDLRIARCFSMLSATNISLQFDNLSC
jgi:hypothetical protein